MATPVVNTVSPNSGPTAGGTFVTVNGSGFTGATSVVFGGTPATSFSVTSDTQLTAVAPAHAAGSVDVQVSAPDGVSTFAQGDAFLYSVPVPTTMGLFPRSGPTTGGTQVNITGSNFSGATSVTFGGAPASFTVTSATQITAVSPAHPAGTVDVVVTTPNGTSIPAVGDQFLYVAAIPAVMGIFPANGPSAGNTIVTLSGSNFAAAMQVTFGGIPAKGFTVLSATQIQAISPPHAAGQVHIQVSSPDGTSATGAPDQFTYTVNASGSPECST